jgi:peptide/nickel transport system ATP-binding protein
VSAPEPLLRLDRLGIHLRRGGRSISIVDSLDLTVRRGEMLTLVGESGSGKTIAALAVMRLLPPGATITGRILLDGADLASLPEPAIRAVRGRDIGMVFQNPLSALNPSHPVGKQIAEPFRIHTAASRRAGRARALELLGEVGIPNPAARIDDYPHQFSGGMRQRVMIAVALACSPRLLIADEPTTGLDPIIARQIMTLIARLRRERDMGVLFITHDLSAIEDQTDTVQVLYAGRTVETGPAAAFFALPRHPYSQALLGSIPRLGQSRLLSIDGTLPEPEARPAGCRFAPRCPYAEPDCTQAYPPPSPGSTIAWCLYPRTTTAAIDAEQTPITTDAQIRPSQLTLDRVSVTYRGPTSLFRRATAPPSLRDITLTLGRGECLGIVGESGSGKSTLGRAVLQMTPYTGQIALDGRPFAGLAASALRAQRRRIQVVFQDPRESLNPRLTIAQSIGEAMRLGGLRNAKECRRRVDELLERVGLSAKLGDMRPDAVSGGQAQRVAIARALAAEPEIIVFDEPTSALDVSTQAMLLNLLKDLLEERGLGYLLITHDLATVSFLAHRIVVLQNGRMVELAQTSRLIASPREDYTAALIAAAPAVRRRPGVPPLDPAGGSAPGPAFISTCPDWQE